MLVQKCRELLPKSRRQHQQPNGVPSRCTGAKTELGRSQARKEAAVIWDRYRLAAFSERHTAGLGSGYLGLGPANTGLRPLFTAGGAIRELPRKRSLGLSGAAASLQ